MCRVLINFSRDTNTVSNPDSNGRYWTNITSNSSNKNMSTAGWVFPSTIIDTCNNDTTLTFEVDEPTDNNWDVQAGVEENVGTLSTVGDYVSPSARDSAISYLASDQVGGRWIIGGLDNAKMYVIKFWGTVASTGNRSIDIATDSGFSDVQTYAADNNTDPDQNASFAISGVTSQTFYIRSKLGDNDFGYVSVIDILEV